MRTDRQLTVPGVGLVGGLMCLVGGVSGREDGWSDYPLPGPPVTYLPPSRGQNDTRMWKHNLSQYYVCGR